MNEIGSYEERVFPAFRNPTIDVLEHGRRKHHIPVLLEIDVTDGRRQLHAIKAATGEALSFTGWVMHCLAQAVSEHKRIHALRKGRHKLILFDDVDISVVVERSVAEQRHPNDSLPMPYIVRRANTKSVSAIHTEIRAAQAAPLAHGDVQLGARRTVAAARLFARLPKLLRNLTLWWRLQRNPFLVKRMIGTVAITSIGNLGKGNGSGWAIPLGIHPLIVALGRIAHKPGVLGESIVIREYLSMTVLFDHDVIDGAPVARFLQRLQELLEAGSGLHEAHHTTAKED
jgi:pyruvate/2-oxoglutarate dehydrogenase complex dihydrolipoamide acyltransferase (E2) component